MQLLKRLILFLLLITVFSSCKLDEIEVGKIESINIVSINQKELVVELNVPVNNQSKMSFKLKSINVNLMLNGVELGKVQERNKIKIKSKTNSVYPVLLQIKFREAVVGLPKLIASIVAGRKMDLQTKGYIVFQKCFITKRFEIDEKNHVNIFNKNK